MATKIHLVPSSIPVMAAASSAAPASNAQEFEILLRRLKPDKKAAVLEKIHRLDNKELIFPQIAELAATRDYLKFQNLFLDPDFDYYALGAVEKSLITPVQFGTLMYVRAGLGGGVKVEDIQAVPLFEGNAPSPKAWKMIKETFQSRNGQFIMDDGELARFFELMRQQPVSEQRFVLIPDVRSQSRNPLNNISVRVNMHAAFNAFCGVELDQKMMRMIPSLGMVQALLDATGDDGFTFKVAIDSATEEEIRLMCIHENARDLRVHSTISPSPKKADGYDSPPIDNIWHEIYHLFTCRHVAKKARKFFSELAALFHPDRYSSRAAKQAAWEIYTTLMDLDIGHYRPDNLGKSIVNKMHMVIFYLLDVLVPARKQYYIFPQEKLSPEEELECARISKELKAKARGLFAVWCLYKSNYKDFEEVADYFDRLDLQQQQQLGEAFVWVQEMADIVSQLKIPREKFDRLSPSQMIKLAGLRNSHFSFIVQSLQEGKSAAEIVDRL
jgi:hypothetical protein